MHARHKFLGVLFVLVLAALIVALNREPPTSGDAVITHVSDGDTVSLSGVGKVRLIGIDTPEVFFHVDCFGPQASAFTKRVLQPGTRVRYRIGREAHDRYGRTLAYVWLRNGRMFNELLAEDGFA